MHHVYSHFTDYTMEATRAETEYVGKPYWFAQPGLPHYVAFPKGLPSRSVLRGSLEVTLSLLCPGKQTTQTELSLVLSCDRDLILTTSVL